MSFQNAPFTEQQQRRSPSPASYYSGGGRSNGSVAARGGGGGSGSTGGTVVKQRRGKGRGEEGRGGFGSAGPLRTGGVGVSRTGGFGTTMPGTSRPTGIAGEAGGGSSGGGKVGDYLMIYSQNVTMLHRMVQQLGTSRDTFELRGQCKCQLEVVNELREKIQTQLKVQQQEAEAASRQDAARLGAMNAKLTKDFNRVNAIALDLGTQAERRMREVDAQRLSQEEADKERARVAFSGASGPGLQQGMLEDQHRRERVQMQEEATNTAIIQETEEELQQINTSLYKVNEIYRDLANIVDQQQEAVEQIETNTEGAHARAQEGLIQVQKANDYQPSCVVS